MLYYILLAASAFLIGLLISRLLGSSRLAAAEARAMNAENNLATMSEELKTLRMKTESMLQEKSKAEQEVYFLNQQLKAKETEQAQLITTLKSQFQVIAQEILETKSKNFSEQSEKQLQELLNPLKKEITDFKTKVESTYENEARERHSLEGRIKELVATSDKVGNQADALVNALRNNTKQQGDWGEVILASILANSGLQAGRDFEEQAFIKTTDGKVIKDKDGNTMRPDVTIYFPDKRNVIVDSKVSLTDWVRYCETTDNAQRNEAMKGHIRSIKKHIDELSAKDYPRYANAFGQVLMFIPIEPAFLEALKFDTNLWKYAYDKKVLMVGPTNLMAVLKIVLEMWKADAQNKNAIQIADRAGELYDKIVNFLDSLNEVGEYLKKAQESHATAVKQLSTGKGNALKKAQDLKEMGANTVKSIPTKYLSDDENNTLTNSENQ